MASRSRTDLTTLMLFVSRCGSAQIGQGSCAVRLQQIEQSRTSSRSASSASARSRAYSGGLFNTWNASRCAVFSPTPGSRAKRTVRRAMGSNAIDQSFPAAGLERFYLELRGQVAGAGTRQGALIESVQDTAGLPGAAGAGAVDAENREVVLLAPDPRGPAARVLAAGRALAQRVEVLQRAGEGEAEAALAVVEKQHLGGGGRDEQLEPEVVFALAAAEAERLDRVHFLGLRIEQARHPRRLTGGEGEDAAALAGGDLGHHERAVATVLERVGLPGDLRFFGALLALARRRQEGNHVVLRRFGEGELAVGLDRFERCLQRRGVSSEQQRDEHHFGNPPPKRLPRLGRPDNGPSAACASCAARSAPLTAARTRSSSIGTSRGSTACLSIWTF